MDGKLIILGAATEPLEVSAIQLLGGRKTMTGWPSGTAIDSEGTCFSACSPAIYEQDFPLERVSEAYERQGKISRCSHDGE